MWPKKFEYKNPDSDEIQPIPQSAYNPSVRLTVGLEVTNSILCLFAIGAGIILLLQLFDTQGFKGAKPGYASAFLIVFGITQFFLQIKFWWYDRDYSIKHKQNVINVFCFNLIWLGILFPTLFLFFFYQK